MCSCHDRTQITRGPSHTDNLSLDALYLSTDGVDVKRFALTPKHVAHVRQHARHGRRGGASILTQRRAFTKQALDRGACKARKAYPWCAAIRLLDRTKASFVPCSSQPPVLIRSAAWEVVISAGMCSTSYSR